MIIFNLLFSIIFSTKKQTQNTKHKYSSTRSTILTIFNFTGTVLYRTNFSLTGGQWVLFPEDEYFLPNTWVQMATESFGLMTGVCG